MSTDEKKVLHVDLVKSKVHIIGLEEEKKSLYGKGRVHKTPSTLKVKIDLHTSEEKRDSPSPISRPNSSFTKGKQVWVSRDDLEKLTISTNLEAPSASSKVIAPKK
ncbi:unnamed protein product [Ilex paraguariensis]|uniref:Uncharacterized protein n=1 Tax=Ilex paraguariensis TaxID=185542 RepID=A0ABC8V0S9_9AQUA